MQHLNKQIHLIQTRKWNFDQNWNNVEHILLRENQQRSEDVQISKQNIQDKINSLNQLQATKVSITNDNINLLKAESGLLEKSSHQTIEKSNDYQNSFEHKCMDFAADYLNNAQAFADRILSYSKNKCDSVQKKLGQINQNIRKKTEQEMKQLRQSSIEHIKNILVNQTANQKAQIQTLSNLVSSSIKNMRQTLKNYEKETMKTQAQLEQKINRLDQEMFIMLNNEKKQGEMTYDCLLKLVEDSCGKIEYLKTR